jgi:SAM-dependent methyltransferase
MLEKPKQWGADYAVIFQDQSVVDAYQHRPTYPPATFAFLSSLIREPSGERTLLDAGCGTGFIARAMAPLVDRVDAVDISAAMILAGQALPGGQRSNLRWIAAPIESAPLHGPYALIVAAASLHWMDWRPTLSRFASHLAPNGLLAIVEHWAQPNPWDAAISPILRRYSMNTDFASYTMRTVVEELQRRRLFLLHGTTEIAAEPFRQPVAAWAESFHARNGFSRERMEPAAAHAFDDALRAAIAPYVEHDMVEQRVGARVYWGKPLTNP